MKMFYSWYCDGCSTLWIYWKQVNYTVYFFNLILIDDQGSKPFAHNTNFCGFFHHRFLESFNFIFHHKLPIMIYYGKMVSNNSSWVILGYLLSPQAMDSSCGGNSMLICSHNGRKLLERILTAQKIGQLVIQLSSSCDS